jgi:heterodisulfide reductase subunit A
MSDHKEPKKIAWFQCVGSRDLNRCDNSYCSSVCCMYAIKEAVIAKEHAGDDLDCAIFYMDMRTHGKDFERFYNKAQDDGVRFVRSRVHTIDPVRDSDDLSCAMWTMTAAGWRRNLRHDRALHRLQTQPGVGGLAGKLGIDLTEGNFCKTEHLLNRWPLPGPAFMSAAPSRGPKTSPSRWWTPAPPRPQPVKSLPKVATPGPSSRRGP